MILTPTSRVGLCLSGGGFRATFFHLGLIKLLWDAQLLGTIKNVWSVSGGSILAANLALAWKEYLKSSEEAAFYRSCLPLFQLAQGNLRGRILRKWAAGRAFSRNNSLVNLLQTNYSQFVAGAELGQFYNTGVAFQLLATSMTTGRLVSFGHAGYNDGERLHPAQHLPVAMAIAASSAFPVMFAPVAVTTDLLNAAEQDFLLRSEQLTDAGVFDNLGATEVLDAAIDNPAAPTFDVLIVSDASLPFDWSPGKKFSWLTTRGSRVSDILMKRVATLEERRRKAYPGKIAYVGIEDVVVPKDIPVTLNNNVFRLQDDTVQRLLPKVRTDLDTFTLAEICCLVRHGYEVGLKALSRLGVPSTFVARDPCLDRFPSIMWPLNEELLGYVGLARSAIHFNASTRQLMKDLEDAQAKLRSMAGLPSAAPPKDSKEDLEKIRRLREHLEKSHRRTVLSRSFQFKTE